MYTDRRERVWAELASELHRRTPHTVLDFGCGDGYWLRRVHQLGNSYELVGYDISPTMLRSAQRRVPEAHFTDSWERQPITKYDVVYCIAVLAHITREAELRRALADIEAVLADGAVFIAFEQTGPVERGGGDAPWIRRTLATYEELGSESGLKLTRCVFLRYRVHRIYERHFLPVLIRFVKGRHAEERALRANNKALLLWLSRLAVKLSGDPLSGDPGRDEGNTLMFFEKAATTKDEVRRATT